jgi:hypothetical protein
MKGMPNALTEVQRHADHRVDLTSDDEVTHWSHQFGVTPDQLRDVVRHAGSRVGDIEAHLQARRGPRPGM